MAGSIKPGTDLATAPFSALIATLFSRTIGAGFSAAAGMVMMGWIVSEVFIVGTHWLQLIYFAVGVAMLVLSVIVEPAQVRATAQRLHLA